MKKIIIKLRCWADEIKQDSIVIFLALNDPRTPLTAKIIGIITCAYAFSPIDLIPDFIPILGYLDDLLLIPLGIIITCRLMPKEILDEYRLKAQHTQRPKSFLGAFCVIMCWIIASAIGIYVFKNFLEGFFYNN